MLPSGECRDVEVTDAGSQDLDLRGQLFELADDTDYRRPEAFGREGPRFLGSHA